MQFWNKDPKDSKLQIKSIISHVWLVCVFALLSVSCEPFTAYAPIEGFDASVNEKLAEFFQRTDRIQGRKVAVFDGDGTTLGQVPHYLADECLFMEAKKHPEKKPAVIAKMKGLSNVSLPYVQLRVHFFEGDKLEDVRRLGINCYEKYYKGKVFRPMKNLISQLQRHNFEVWVITASPEALYQGFLSRELGIPITRVVGVKSIIRNGRITTEIIRPVPQDKGKMEAIESFVQTRPLLSAGNSRGDKEMIEFSSDLHIIVNPDTHIAPDQTESIADYAKKEGWLVVRINDTAAPDFPRVSSKEFGIRLNKSHPAAKN